jgi:hypothetical protein
MRRCDCEAVGRESRIGRAALGARHISTNQTNPSPSPELRAMLQTQEGRAQVLSAWQQVAELHRHEDRLLNNRLQTFLVSTTVLVAAFSQFHEPELKSLLIRVLISVVGFSLALVTLYVLWRTLRAIEWYLGMLGELDQLLFPPELQPYSRRRREMPLRTPLNRIQGLWIPAAVAILWLVLVGLTFALPSKP